MGRIDNFKTQGFKVNFENFKIKSGLTILKIRSSGSKNDMLCSEMMQSVHAMLGRDPFPEMLL